MDPAIKEKITKHRMCLEVSVNPIIFSENGVVMKELPRAIKLVIDVENAPRILEDIYPMMKAEHQKKIGMAIRKLGARVTDEYIFDEDAAE